MTATQHNRKLIRRPLILWNATQAGDQPSAATIIFRRDDPFAVVITFSRALLIDGLEAPAGEGAVRVEPTATDFDFITFTLPLTADGVRFYAERGPLEAFVDATYQIVPLGSELLLASKELDMWLIGVTS